MAQTEFQQGVNQSHLGDYQGALQTFDRLLQHHAENAEAYGYRCIARHKLGDRRGAIADCQQAVALYLKQGKTEEYRYALTILGMLDARGNG